MIRDVVDDAQAVQWKDELKEFVKVNDERGVEGDRNLKGFLNISFHHANQVFPLTTSNFFNSSALHFLLLKRSS